MIHLLLSYVASFLVVLHKQQMAQTIADLNNWMLLLIVVLQ